MNPRVSVCITTYNHEPYIAQALESVLAQRVDFLYEIIIGEDESSDRTREIVQGYRDRHPDLIRLFLNKRHNVIYIDGQPTGRWNFTNNLKQARGDYIALLEGDDFWTDPFKLQRQVELLDRHPAWAMCFHKVEFVDNDGLSLKHIKGPLVAKDFYTLEDLLVYCNFIPTPSVVFRRGLFGEFPQWFYSIPVGDWPLHILNAHYGDIGFIDEVLAAYRVTGRGVFSGHSKIDNLARRIKTYHLLDNILGYRYHNLIARALVSHHYELAVQYGKVGDKKKSAFCAIHGIFSFWPPLATRWRYTKILLKSLFPTFCSWVLKIKTKAKPGGGQP